MEMSKNNTTMKGFHGGVSFICFLTRVLDKQIFGYPETEKTKAEHSTCLSILGIQPFDIGMTLSSTNVLGCAYSYSGMYTDTGWTHLLEGPLAMEKMEDSLNTVQDGGVLQSRSRKEP